MADDLSQIMGYESPFGQNGLFSNSHFGQYWEKNLPDWAKPLFGDSLILDKSKIVIADISSRVSHRQADRYNSLIVSDSSKYTFRVFAHPDGIESIENVQ